MGRPTWMVGRIESVSNSQRIGRLIIPEGYRTIICGLVIGRTVLDSKAQPLSEGDYLSGKQPVAPVVSLVKPLFPGSYAGLPVSGIEYGVPD
jgi:hypothetical protein